MYRTSVVIIAAGQAGLSVSRLLAAVSVEHVVLERGRVAARWRSQRWDSLRLLTPNWMTRLPDWSYRGPDAAGFMRSESVAAMLDACPESFGAPVVTGVEVLSVRGCGDRLPVETAAASRTAAPVVVATGHCTVPSRRQAVRRSRKRRRPALDRRGPRRDSYGDRGSVQLASDEAGREVDLRSLALRGIDIAGRIDGYADGTLTRRDDLAENRAAADAKLHRLLESIDEFAVRTGLNRELEPAERPIGSPPTGKPSQRRLERSPRAISTVIWATGYRRHYDWLHVPVLDAAGVIRHVAGRTPVKGRAAS